MAFRNTAVVKVILAWDTVNNKGKTGDGANFTVRGVGDGAEFTPASPSITEIDSTNLPGYYSVALAGGENNYHTVSISGKSSTAGISIFGPQWDNEVNANVVQALGNAITTAVNGVMDVNAKYINSIITTSVTAVNAVVGSAQAFVFNANNFLKVSLNDILATTLTETSGQLAAGFKKFFDVGSPTLTTGGTNQTGDSYVRLGAPVGASISADIAALVTTIGASCSGIATAVWGAATRTLTSGLNIILAKGTGVTGFNDIAATSIVSNGAITTSSGKVSGVATVDTVTGLTASNIDATISSRLAASSYTAPSNSAIATILSDVQALNNLSSDDITTALAAFSASQPAQTFAAKGAIPTRDQFLHMIWAKQTEVSIIGTTMVVNKLDGSTPAMTFTLTIDESGNVTAATRAS